MTTYNSIKEIKSNVNFNDNLISLLELLEKINPCNQSYEVIGDSMVVSYLLKINLLNFSDLFQLNLNTQIIGLPISISEKGYLGKEALIEKIVRNRKGLKIILNGDNKFSSGGQTLSTFIFHNRFSTFEDYIKALRSPYRRRINKALLYREDLEVKRLDKKDFNDIHYGLYLSIMNRTEHPLEILPKDFFTEYEAELYEFVDKETKDIVGFIQLKLIGDKLCFLFGGFRKEDNDKYDIYYNILLKIIEIGIAKQVKTIEFGQTAEESKLKIGCKEAPKYVYIHHSNRIINWFIKKLTPLFSYKPYSIKHNVFKEIEDIKVDKL